MDEKVPLAREEGEGRSELLDSTGTGAPRKRAVRGGKRTKIPRSSERNKGSQTERTPPKGKGRAKAESRDGRRGRRGRTYSLRDTIREAKARNPAPGRSAKELGIVWLDPRCEESPRTKAHFFIAKTTVNGGSVYQCKYCQRVKWMPNSLNECQEMWRMMQVYGLDGGYQKILDKNPSARRLLSKIQDIYYLRKSMPPEHFPIAVAAVMLDREYPYDVEITEEDVL